MKVKINKFNPFHDSNGRFSSSNGMKTFSANPYTKEGQMAMQRHKGTFGNTMNVHQNSKGHTNLENVSYLNGRRILIVNSKLQTMGGTNRQARLAAANAGEPYQSKTSPKVVGGAPSQQAASQNQAQAKPAAQQNQNQGAAGSKEAFKDMTKDVVLTEAVKKSVEPHDVARDVVDADHRHKVTDDREVEHKDFQPIDSNTVSRRGMSLEDVRKAQGDDGGSSVVNNLETFQKLAQESGILLARSVDSRKSTKNMTEKEIFEDIMTNGTSALNDSGGQVHGAGLYLVHAYLTPGNSQSDVARNRKSVDAAQQGSFPYGTKQCMATLHPKAKIATRTIAKKLKQKYDNDPALRAKFKDIGAYIASQGYDGAHWNGYDGGYTTIYNKSALVWYGEAYDKKYW